MAKGKIHWISYPYNPGNITHDFPNWIHLGSSWVTAIRSTRETIRAGGGKRVIQGSTVNHHLDVWFNDGTQWTYPNLGNLFHQMWNAPIYHTTVGKFVRSHLYHMPYTDLVLDINGL